MAVQFYDKDGNLWEGNTLDDPNPRPIKLAEKQAAPAEPQNPLLRKPKSLAVQAADLVRPELSSEYPNLSALGQVGADLFGGFVGMGDNMKNLPAGLAGMVGEIGRGKGGEVASNLWDFAKENPLSTATGLIPGAGLGTGVVTQALDQQLRGDNQPLADQFSDILTSGVGNALPALVRRAAPEVKPALQAAGRAAAPVAERATAAAERVAPQAVNTARRAAQTVGNTAETLRRGVVKPVGKMVQAATGIPGAALVREGVRQLQDPTIVKDAVKHFLSRASGIPIEAIEEVVRNPDLMAKYMSLGEDAWQRFAETQQAHLRDLPKIEGKVYESALDSSSLKPDVTTTEIVDVPVTGNVLGPDGKPVQTMQKQEITRRVIGTPVDSSPAAQAFDAELRKLGVIDDAGKPTIGNAETEGLLQIPKNEAEHLLDLRERVASANSFSTVKAAMKQIEEATSYSGKAVKPIGTQADGALKQVRGILGKTLEAADTSGAIAAANNRYAKFRKFFDDMQPKLGGDGASRLLRNVEKGEKTLLQENLQRLHGQRPLLDIDPRYPTPEVTLRPSGSDALREADLMTKGDYFNPNRPEPITSSGRDMMGLGTLALSGLAEGLTGQPVALPAAAATGLLWYNTRPGPLGRTLTKFGRMRNTLGKGLTELNP